MPQVREYFSPVDQLHPAEQGAEALARSARLVGSMREQAGRAIGEGLNAAAQPLAQAYDRHQTMDEISTGAAAMAAITNKTITGWHDTLNTADYNDHEVGQRYMQEQV
jgi:hypothetical protein